MLVIGLTGGIGMGKSTAAALLAGFGLPLHNADHAVHALLAKGGQAVKPVAKLFPDVMQKGAINRTKLAQQVFGQPAKLKKLEKILHPLVVQAEQEFLHEAQQNKHRAAVLEIPLLFETKAEKRCDVVLCVSAPKAVQKARVMRRKGMTETKFKAILDRQMPDAEKRRWADFVIGTGVSKAATKKQLMVVLHQLGVLESPHA